MHLIDPEVLDAARGLTAAMSGTIAVLGLALWLFGWRWHRFWVVSGITLTAGVIGLNAAGGASGQVLAAGLLLAVAAGMMALELAKILAFAAGGVAAWLAAQWVLPQAQELWAVFLSGGLLGVLLYRVWTMLLTSLTGTLLFSHAGLLLLEPLAGFNAAAWVAANAAAANGLVVGLTVLGVLLQAKASPELSDEKDEIEEPKKDHKKGDDHGHGHGEDHGDGDEKGSGWLRRVIPFRRAA